MPQLRPCEGCRTVTPAALPAAAPRPAEHPCRGWCGGGCWVSLHGRQAELVIGDSDDGKATLAGGPAAVPAGLAARCLPPRFYGHRVSSCGGDRLRSALRSQSGRGKL